MPGRNRELLRGCRVLVVEDESLVAMLVEDMLRDLGAEVEVAMRAEEGLRLAVTGSFALALLDINIGGGQRSDAIADTLRDRGIPFLFATGYGKAGVAERHREAATIQKPYLARELDRAISIVLDR